MGMGATQMSIEGEQSEWQLRGEWRGRAIRNQRSAIRRQEKAYTEFAKDTECAEKREEIVPGRREERKFGLAAGLTL
jgi:hypothetical protein